MMIREPFASGTPTSLAITCSPPPGAQAPSQAASSSAVARLDARCRRSRSSPRPSRRASLASAAATCAGGTRNRITWCTTFGCPGRMFSPVMKASLSQVRVEHEAAVVVGAVAVRRRRRVRRRASSAGPAAPPARSGLLADRGRGRRRRAPAVGRGRRALRRPARPAALAVPVLQPASDQRSSEQRAPPAAYRRRGGSSRRPAHRAAAEHVQVGVEDGLVGRRRRC